MVNLIRLTNYMSRPLRSARCIAVIGDIVNSRRVGSEDRQDFQQLLQGAIDHVNRLHTRSILAKFVITAGDEFQGLLSKAQPLPDIIWMIEKAVADWASENDLTGIVDVRFGVGCGRLETELKKFAVGMDGSVWHEARQALKTAESKRRLGGLFSGFSEPDQTIINAFAALLRQLREQMTHRQLEVLDALRNAGEQKAVAATLKISKQAVHKHVAVSGWEEYKEGKAAMELALSRFDFSAEWSRR